MLAPRHTRPPGTEKTKDQKLILLLLDWEKAFDQIKREYGKYVIKKFSFKDKKNISFNEADEVGKEIISLFNQNKFDKCIIFYNNFKNVITQIPQAQQIIPAETKNLKESNDQNF